MTGKRIPVLWLCGPPGVGKTVVAWEIFTQLSVGGVDAGYVDIDQLGICYPEQACDPGRHRLKERNLGAVVANFRAAGARCVVVSGVVDPVRGVDAGRLPSAVLTMCRLRAGPDELKRRILSRGGPEAVDDALREAETLDGSDVADVCVGTSDAGVAETARLVRERTGGWPGRDVEGPSAPTEREGGAGPGAPVMAATPAGPGRPSAGARPEAPILWLCGAAGVGKSAVGFAVYERLRSTGLTAAYIDLDQIGFCRPAPAEGNHRVKARNLAALWSAYREAGAQRLVVTGPVEDAATIRLYASACGGAAFRLCRLHAGRHELTRRIMLRGQGHGWEQPGDPLRGRPAAHLRQIADRAAAEAEALDRAGLGDVRVDTDGRPVAEIAASLA